MGGVFTTGAGCVGWAGVSFILSWSASRSFSSVLFSLEAGGADIERSAGCTGGAVFRARFGLGVGAGLVTTAGGDEVWGVCAPIWFIFCSNAWRARICASLSYARTKDGMRYVATANANRRCREICMKALITTKPCVWQQLLTRPSAAIRRGKDSKGRFSA